MPSKHVYKSLTMEIRPRIQSVNVYITLSEPNTVAVTLNVDNFEVIIGSIIQSIRCDDFHINRNSLTCFANTDNQVTFRFTTRKAVSTYCYDLLELDMRSCSISNTNPTTFLSENTDYTIMCKNCSQSLCENINFKRVLPLPDNLDSSDWFCHSHDDDKFVLTPKENEVFYSQCFVLVNPGTLQGLSRDGLVLKCDACDSWLGSLHKDAFKIWFNTVIFACSDAKHNSCPLSDCLKTFLIDSDTPLRSVRIVLKCFENPCDEVLLLWVLEPKLRVKFFDGNGKFDGNVAKVLFESDDIGSDLVSQWMSDLNVTVFDVSKPMIDKLREHLNETGRYIPKDFSTSNGFCVSYIKLCENNKSV